MDRARSTQKLPRVSGTISSAMPRDEGNSDRQAGGSAIKFS